MRLGLCLCSPRSSLRWCLQFPWFFLLSRFWRFPDVYLHLATDFLKQAVSGQEAMEAWCLNLYLWSLLIWITPSLSTQVCGFSLRTVVLSRCCQLSRGRGQKRKEKPDYIRSDSGGRPLGAAVTDIGWVFSWAGNWWSLQFSHETTPSRL